MEYTNFEEAMKRLEKIADELELGNLTLDESFETFKEGMDISAYCNKKLDEIEKRVSILIRQNDDKMVEMPFEAIKGDKDE
ncbi:MAG: exodeoxyribonuclease VII small subunit [Deltaproteobacteria bacterium]